MIEHQHWCDYLLGHWWTCEDKTCKGMMNKQCEGATGIPSWKPYRPKQRETAR